MAYAKSAAMYVSIAEERQPAKRRQSVRFAVSDMARWIQTIIPEISSGLRPQRPTNRNINAVERQSLQKKIISGKMGYAKPVTMHVSIVEERQPAKRRQSAE